MTTTLKTLLFSILICTFANTVIIQHTLYTTKPPIKYMRDYQIEVTQDSIFIMDNLRHVGTISYTDDSGLGKIIEDDNE